MLALAATSFWYGRFAFQNTANPPDYYWMAPAITFATGQPFGKPLPAKNSPLYEFLTRQRAELSVADAKAQIDPPDLFDYQERYLFLAVGYWWRIAGIKWTAVAQVAAALHVLAILGVYATLRLFTPLLLSLTGALWMSVSSLQLMFVPHVRDYSKAAFILATIPLAVTLAYRARSRVTMFAAAVAVGIVIGVGIGFRQDVIVMVPITVACVLLFRGRRPWTSLSEKAQLVAVFMLALIVTSLPIVSKFSTKGSNSYHVILLGYADPFDDALGVTRSMYRVLPYYDDAYVAAVLSARTETQTGRELVFSTPAYDRAGRELWIDVLRHFPADVFARVLGACNSSLNLLFANQPMPLLHPMPAESFWRKTYAGLNHFKGWGVALGVMLMVVASLAAPRLGALAAFLLLALGGYPSLQFGDRHYFHLQAIPVFALLTVCWAVIVSPAWIRRARWRSVLVQLGVLAIGLLMVTVVPLRVLQAYQSRHVDGLVSGFLAGPRTTITPEFVQRPDAKWLLRWPGVAGKRSGVGPLSWAYYLVEFDADVEAPPAIGLRFRSGPNATACLRVLTAPPKSGLVRFGVATYSYPGHEFEGFEIRDDAVKRVRGIYRMAENGPAEIPLELRLPEDWRRRPLYQRLDLQGGLHEAGAEEKMPVAFWTCT